MLELNAIRIYTLEVSNVAKGVSWNKVSFDTFAELGMLTDEEKIVLETRIKGWTRTKQSRELNISMATLDRIIARIKRKYDEVQPHAPDILPVRRFSKEEDYMDNN